MKTRILFAFFLIPLFQCESINDKEEFQPELEAITVQIEAASVVGGKPVYLKLYKGNVNIYNPSETPLLTKVITLDENGEGSVILTDSAIIGENYQISGAIDISGNDYKTPETGDRLFCKKITVADGGVYDTIENSDLYTYKTISGNTNNVSTGKYFVRIWLENTWKGSNSLGWIRDADNMTFTYNGSGGAIGRVGKASSKHALVDDVDSCIVSVQANISGTGGGSYYFCVYGWVFSDLVSWSKGSEFYVIEDCKGIEYDPLIGSITVDSIKYNMHRYKFPDNNDYRFKAIRVTDKRLNATINMKPFFEYWRKNGMENYYLTEITWAIELLAWSGGTHNGKFYCWDINIPDF